MTTVGYRQLWTKRYGYSVDYDQQWFMTKVYALIINEEVWVQCKLRATISYDDRVYYALQRTRITVEAMTENGVWLIRYDQQSNINKTTKLF